MRLEFVPVDAFYFALTLDTRLLQSWEDEALVSQVGARLREHLGQPSTVAAAEQNTFNYVFRVSEAGEQTVLEVFDWGRQLRLSSNFGLERAADGKVTRLPTYEERPAFARRLSAHLGSELGLNLPG